MDDKEKQLIQKCYADYIQKQPHYDDINKYYYGNTDSLKNFTPITGRSNLKATTNFVGKLTDEEAQYSFSNPITYTAKDDNKNVINDIELSLLNNKAEHDINLGIELVKMGVCYEISYLTKDLKFKNKIVSPLNGYMYIVDDEPKYFLHMFKKQLDEKNYIDVYTDKFIYHFDSGWMEVSDATPHYFGIVPVGYGIIGGVTYNIDRGYEEGDKTIYRTIKTLQDAFETNLSDAVCEISDTRNAIMKMYGIELEDEKDEEGNVITNPDGSPKKKAPLMRGNNVLFFDNKSEADADWLIKNINSPFIKDTRDDVKELIYALTSHIDSNEKMQSNLSGVSLRSRLQNLEAKCRMNENAMRNIIKTRLICLFRYLDITEDKTYDANLIKIEFTPCVPVDLNSLADTLSKVPHEVMSWATRRAMFPNISNSDLEQSKIDKEVESTKPSINLDTVGDINGQV